MKTYTLKEVEDKLIGKIGTSDRDDYELRIKLLQFGQLIKEVRKEKGMTQVELGDLIGVRECSLNCVTNKIIKFDYGTEKREKANYYKR